LKCIFIHNNQNHIKEGIPGLFALSYMTSGTTASGVHVLGLSTVVYIDMEGVDGTSWNGEYMISQYVVV
jgi:hypothetical protein